MAFVLAFVGLIVLLLVGLIASYIVKGSSTITWAASRRGSKRDHKALLAANNRLREDLDMATEALEEIAAMRYNRTVAEAAFDAVDKSERILEKLSNK